MRREACPGIVDPVTGLCATIDALICGPNVFELLDPATDFAPTDVHPNATGHAKIADALADAPVAIPEPATHSLLGLGLGLIGTGARKRRASRGDPS